MEAADLVRPGEVIADKYRVKGVIGQGGVGVVVAADHMTLRRPVAIKFIRPEIAYEPEVVRRFLREARATAQLRSEHVARVMDVDKIDDGPAYLVMELLDGRDFGAVLKEDGPLPVDAAVDYILQACDAVAEAHALGIVHRDIKAANLFLTRGPGGKPLIKVLDFGLSKVAGPEARASSMSLTSANHVLGSPHYMSPEQMRSSRDADARSDIWALGVVLYTFLAGRVPFEGTFLTEVCAAVLSGSAPSVKMVRPEVPDGLADVIARCMRLEPEDRYQSVAELVAALAPFRETSALPAVPVAAPVEPAAPSTVRPIAATIAGVRPARSLERQTVVRWGLAAAGAAALVAVVALLGRAPRAADSTPPPVVSTSAATTVDPPPAPPPTSAPTPSVAVRAPSSPATTHDAPVRRAPATGARRPSPAASPATAVRSAPAKADEDVIMGLPH
jgi:serine/threonine-protein kinase